MMGLNILYFATIFGRNLIVVQLCYFSSEMLCVDHRNIRGKQLLMSCNISRIWIHSLWDIFYAIYRQDSHIIWFNINIDDSEQYYLYRSVQNYITINIQPIMR